MQGRRIARVEFVSLLQLIQRKPEAGWLTDAGNRSICKAQYGVAGSVIRTLTPPLAYARAVRRDTRMAVRGVLW